MTEQAGARPMRRGFRSHWERHPAVLAGEELTRGERAADAMRNRMGSWAFVLGFGAILLIAAKRSDQIASQLAQHDYETDTQAFERIEAVHDRLTQMAEENRCLLEQNTRILDQLVASGGPKGEDERSVRR